MLKCGASKVEINPDLPINLAGYGPDNVATGIHDDLNVNCLFLEQGREQIALLSYDIITVDAELIEEIQEQGSKAVGIPPRSILLTASHTHSGPRPTRKWSSDPDDVREKYRKRLIERSVQALEQASGRTEPVVVSCNTARIRENMNRRVFLPDGQYYYQPRRKQLLPLAEPAVDDELGVLFFKRAKGKGYVATLVCYTAHPLTVGDTSMLVTADYPGVLKREIEESLGGTAVFVNGASGDNHPLGAEAGFSRTEHMGRALAEKALYHRWDSVTLDDPVIGSEYREVLLPALTEKAFKKIPNRMGAKFRGAPKEKLVGGKLRTWVSVWAIGPIAFTGVPGELCAELGLRIKWESPFPRTYPMFISTDSIGYIAHRNAYAWGGYEAVHTRVGPRGGAEIVDGILAAAEDLKKRLETGGNLCALPLQKKLIENGE